MVKTIQLEGLRNLAKYSAYQENVDEAIDLLKWSEKAYGKESPPRYILGESNLQKEDIETFVNNGLLVEDPLVKGGGAMNPVGEAAKRRRRVTHDLLWLNATSPEPTRVRFHSIADLHLITETCSFATALDMKCWFYQFPIDKTLGRLCGIQFQSRTYRMTRLPMGLKHAVVIAQSVLRCLADTGVPGVTASMYIDNVMFAGNRRQQVDNKLEKSSSKDANKLAQQSATWDTPLQQQWNSEV